jgi:hypothetical protein
MSVATAESGVGSADLTGVTSAVPGGGTAASPADDIVRVTSASAAGSGIGASGAVGAASAVV